MTNSPGLPLDWVYSPSIDLELKQYALLGYLQHVRARFAERKLYPYLEQLRDHVDALRSIRRSKEDLARYLEGKLIGFDLRSGEVIRERTAEDEMLAVIDEVIAFAVPNLTRMSTEGFELRHEFAERIHFTPVGLQPLHASEGWLFLRKGREARVYGYSIPMVIEQHLDHPERKVVTRYVTSYAMGITCTYEHIKSDLIARHPALPNPATFVLETDLDLPFIETFVPLAKRFVLAHVTDGH
ncbi:MAG: hypothetical protein KDC00_03645 [Flavobacteriales bacterium]|nr:hypothetical protein [Flavobacteriales bacterium]